MRRTLGLVSLIVLALAACSETNNSNDALNGDAGAIAPDASVAQPDSAIDSAQNPPAEAAADGSGTDGGPIPDAGATDVGPVSDAGATDVGPVSDAGATDADAGVICRPGAPLSCNADPGAVVSMGTCDDAGTCTCAAKAVRDDATGKCRTAPVCVVGQDQTCNDDLAVSSIEGACEVGGVCWCNAGFDKNPSTGKCTKHFEQALPVQCTTDDDCCVIAGRCGVLYLTTQVDQAPYASWMGKMNSVPGGGLCPPCITYPVDLRCDQGICVGIQLKVAAPQPHCGRLVVPSVDAAAKTSLSYFPHADLPLALDAGASDAAGDASVQKTVFGCM
jgi:hypothetical protein